MSLSNDLKHEFCENAEQFDALMSKTLAYMEKLESGVFSTKAINNVIEERQRQDNKWGGAGHDDQHSVSDFVLLIEDYAGWARTMAGMRNLQKARNRLIQVAALAVAAVESIDRKSQRETYEHR